jgi:uncharacterized membrane protein
MGIVHDILAVITVMVSGLGAIVVIWGVAESAKSFVFLKFIPQDKDAIKESEAIRLRLGAHLLLGLEIFIAADIISSVVSPSWEKVGILGAIVGIRTVLSYFLRMELIQGMHE